MLIIGSNCADFGFAQNANLSTDFVEFAYSFL